MLHVGRGKEMLHVCIYATRVWFYIYYIYIYIIYHYTKITVVSVCVCVCVCVTGGQRKP